MGNMFPAQVIQVVIEFLAGPQPLHHAPTLQMVGGMLGHLGVARALCALDQWLRTLYTAAVSWRHFPPRGTRVRDVSAIYHKLMRVTHTPSFLQVHTFFLPAMDTVLLPACMDLGPVLFGAMLPMQIPTWVQLGFVIRQIVNHLREQMQLRGKYLDRPPSHMDSHAAGQIWDALGPRASAGLSSSPD